MEPQAAWEALGCVTGTIPKENLPSLLKVARDAVSTVRDKERRKRKVDLFFWQWYTFTCTLVNMLESYM